MHFFPNFRQTLWIETTKRVSNKGICCPIDSSEEFIAVCFVKMSQIDTENDKNPKVFKFF